MKDTTDDKCQNYSVDSLYTNIHEKCVIIEDQHLSLLTSAPATPPSQQLRQLSGHSDPLGLVMSAYDTPQCLSPNDTSSSYLLSMKQNNIHANISSFSDGHSLVSDDQLQGDSEASVPHEGEASSISPLHTTGTVDVTETMKLDNYQHLVELKAISVPSNDESISSSDTKENMMTAQSQNLVSQSLRANFSRSQSTPIPFSTYDHMQPNSLSSVLETERISDSCSTSDDSFVCIDTQEVVNELSDHFFSTSNNDVQKISIEPFKDACSINDAFHVSSYLPILESKETSRANSIQDSNSTLNPDCHDLIKSNNTDCESPLSSHGVSKSFDSPVERISNAEGRHSSDCNDVHQTFFNSTKSCSTTTNEHIVIQSSLVPKSVINGSSKKTQSRLNDSIYQADFCVSEENIVDCPKQVNESNVTASASRIKKARTKSSLQKTDIMIPDTCGNNNSPLTSSNIILSTGISSAGGISPSNTKHTFASSVSKDGSHKKSSRKRNGHANMSEHSGGDQKFIVPSSRSKNPGTSNTSDTNNKNGRIWKKWLKFLPSSDTKRGQSKRMKR